MVNTRRLVSIGMQQRSFEPDFPPLIGWDSIRIRFFFDTAISFSKRTLRYNLIGRKRPLQLCLDEIGVCNVYHLGSIPAT